MNNGEPKDILIMTADAVKHTGRVTYMFMINGDPKREVASMPQMFGVIREQDDGSKSFNVFDGGKGLVVGGGWTEHDSPDWEKRVLNAIPSCTLLMDIDLLDWWKELTSKHGTVFRHHHFPGILQTS